MTHLDAFEHFYWRGESFGDAQLDRVIAGEEPLHDVVDVSQGVVTRAVLIDVEHAVELGEIEPGLSCSAAQLRRILARSGLRVEPGDALFVRMSRSPVDGSRSGGLSLDCVDWITEIRPSIVVSDGGFDPHPSEVDDVLMPWHIILLTALGVHLIDLADLEALARECRVRQRYSFAALVAPLGIAGSTSTPVNPLAVF
ncbi:cyclase family protein [Microbacterium sp. PMB16]